MTEKIILANWKMNFLKKDALDFIRKFSEKNYDNKIIIAPPYHLIDSLKNYLKEINNDNIKICAQNSSHINDFGAYTGEISAYMLKDIGCDYILVGHSERRKLGEDENIISKKITNILANSLSPILCIGETQKEKDQNLFKNVISKQLEILDSIDDILIAYEPIWSIGTNITPNIAEISDIFDYITKLLQQRFAKSPKILYGGSVSNKNTKEIFSVKNLAGILVGSASLNINNFMEICNIR